MSGSRSVDNQEKMRKQCMKETIFLHYIAQEKCSIDTHFNSATAGDANQAKVSFFQKNPNSCFKATQAVRMKIEECGHQLNPNPRHK